MHTPSTDTDAARIARLIRQDDAAFLSGAYHLALGRGVDAAGQAYYSRLLSQGMTRLDVLRELARSDEGVAYLSDLPGLSKAILDGAEDSTAAEVSLQFLMSQPDSDFVELSARGMEARLDASERTQLVRLLQGGVARHIVLQRIASASPLDNFRAIGGLDEFLARLRSHPFPVARTVRELFFFHDEAFVDCAYHTLLGRAPDGSGKLHYLSHVRSGYSRSWVIEGLARSPEAEDRPAQVEGVLALCGRYRVARLLRLPRFLAVIIGAESDTRGSRVRRMLRSMLTRLNALETGVAAVKVEPGRQASASDVLETRLLARHEALLDIQRDNFERELSVLRAMVSRLVNSD